MSRSAAHFRNIFVTVRLPLRVRARNLAVAGDVGVQMLARQVANRVAGERARKFLQPLADDVVILRRQLRALAVFCHGQRLAALDELRNGFPQVNPLDRGDGGQETVHGFGQWAISQLPRVRAELRPRRPGLKRACRWLGNTAATPRWRSARRRPAPATAPCPALSYVRNHLVPFALGFGVGLEKPSSDFWACRPRAPASKGGSPSAACKSWPGPCLYPGALIALGISPAARFRPLNRPE